MQFSRFIKKKRIYLDHAATTPVRPEVYKVMEPYFSERFGNASSIHVEGQTTKAAVDDARLRVARTLKVRPRDITFTSGGTESNNLAILGHIEYLIHEAKVSAAEIEIISTGTEHPSVTKVLDWITEHGVKVHQAPIDEAGLIVIDEFKALLSPKTRLVTVAYANSETGVVQPLSKLGRLIAAFEKEQGTTILFHADGAQAPLWLPCDPERLHVDMISLDAGKCYGPKGAGVLVHRPKAKLSAVTYGGSQESGLRPGTENTPLIVGTAKALELAQTDYQARSERVSKLRDYLVAQLQQAIPDAVLNGSPTDRLANNVNISIPGLDTEFAVVTLDKEGIAASTKSACSGADGGGSAVVRHMTGDEERAASTIRFSLGEDTKRSEIDRAVAVLAAHVKKMRAFQETLTQG